MAHTTILPNTTHVVIGGATMTLLPSYAFLDTIYEHQLLVLLLVDHQDRGHGPMGQLSEAVEEEIEERTKVPFRGTGYVSPTSKESPVELIRGLCPRV